MVGSVFNMNDSGSERDTESEDRVKWRRRLATLRKRRQRSKNADNDRKRIRHTETQQASQRRSKESREGTGRNHLIYKFRAVSFGKLRVSR